MSSPYLCVCGDDHVTCYMGADDNPGKQADFVITSFHVGPWFSL